MNYGPTKVMGNTFSSSTLPAQDISRPRFDLIADHFETNLNSLHEILNSLQSVADRLGGAVPMPTAGKGEAQNEQPNSALRLERIAGYQSSSIQEITQLIQRLNQL